MAAAYVPDTLVPFAKGMEYDDEAVYVIMRFSHRGQRFVVAHMRDNGRLGLPGGKVEGDETPQVAGKRECTEEIGMLPGGFSPGTTFLRSMTRGTWSCKTKVTVFQTNYDSGEKTPMRDILASASMARDVGSETLGVVFLPMRGEENGWTLELRQRGKAPHTVLSHCYEFPTLEILTALGHV